MLAALQIMGIEEEISKQRSIEKLIEDHLVQA